MNQNKKKKNIYEEKKTSDEKPQPATTGAPKFHPDTCGKYFSKWNLMQEKKRKNKKDAI